MKTTLIILAFIVLSGCNMFGFNSDMATSTAVGLKTAKGIVIATGTTAKRLCDSGDIREEDCKTAEYAYSESRKILNEARVIWEHMVEVDDFSESENYEKLLERAIVLSDVIEKIVIRYTEGTDES